MPKELVKLVQDAVSALIAEQPSLLELAIHEQSISHRIAMHLEQRVEAGLHVDCEYNRHLDFAKIIEISDIDHAARKTCGCSACRDTNDPIDRERRFRPDIILHQRNTDAQNLIVVEVKRDKFCPFDEAKIKAMTKQQGVFRYRIGVFIYFLKDSPEFLWYTDGNRFEP